MHKNFGTIEFNGKTLYLQQDAYLENNHLGEAAYFANARDENNEFEYKVEWEIINHETEDSSDHCDWDNPYDIKKIGYVL